MLKIILSNNEAVGLLNRELPFVEIDETSKRLVRRGPSFVEIVEIVGVIRDHLFAKVRR
jgi:hypothetical protein